MLDPAPAERNTPMPDNQRKHSGGDEMVDSADYDDHWRTIYQTTPYYAHKRKWTDYGPAYRLGYTGHACKLPASCL